MAQSVNDVDTLHEYLCGVMGRADHHAGTVNAVCLAIAGGVIWRNDGEIEVRTHGGNMTNQLWFYVNGNRFAVSFNHETRQIDIRPRTDRQQPIVSFDNSNAAAEVFQFFSRL